MFTDLLTCPTCPLTSSLFSPSGDIAPPVTFFYIPIFHLSHYMWFPLFCRSASSPFPVCDEYSVLSVLHHSLDVLVFLFLVITDFTSISFSFCYVYTLSRIMLFARVMCKFYFGCFWLEAGDLTLPKSTKILQNVKACRHEINLSSNYWDFMKSERRDIRYCLWIQRTVTIAASNNDE